MIGVIEDSIVYNRIIIAGGSQPHAILRVIGDGIVQNSIIAGGAQIDANLRVIGDSIVFNRIIAGGRQ